MLCCLLSPIFPTHLRKDKSFMPLPVGKLAEILATTQSFSFALVELTQKRKHVKIFNNLTQHTITQFQYQYHAGDIHFLLKLGSIISKNFGRHKGSKTHATRHILTFCHPELNNVLFVLQFCLICPGMSFSYSRSGSTKNPKPQTRSYGLGRFYFKVCYLPCLSELDQKGSQVNMQISSQSNLNINLT